MANMLRSAVSLLSVVCYHFVQNSAREAARWNSRNQWTCEPFANEVLAARYFEEYFREKSLFPPGQGRQALKKTLKKTFLQAHETIIEGSKNLSTTTYEGEEYTLEEKVTY